MGAGTPAQTRLLIPPRQPAEQPKHIPPRGWRCSPFPTSGRRCKGNGARPNQPQRTHPLEHIITDTTAQARPLGRIRINGICARIPTRPPAKRRNNRGTLCRQSGFPSFRNRQAVQRKRRTPKATPTSAPARTYPHRHVCTVTPGRTHPYKRYLRPYPHASARQAAGQPRRAPHESGFPSFHNRPAVQRKRRTPKATPTGAPTRTYPHRHVCTDTSAQARLHGHPCLSHQPSSRTTEARPT